MPGKSIEERIAENKKKIEQIQAQTKALESQAAQKDRKARTRMLIQMGGIMARLGFDLGGVQELQRDAGRRPEVHEYLVGLIARATARSAGVRDVDEDLPADGQDSSK